MEDGWGVNHPKNMKEKLLGYWCRYKLIIIFLLLSVLIAFGCAPKEEWNPQVLSNEDIFIPDFSFSGYKWGETEIPIADGEVFNIVDFGAIPNDKKDDTEAMKNAFQAAHNFEGNVIVYFPEGRFILKDFLFIERSNFVLRGAGKSKTTLYMPLALNEIPIPEYQKELEEYLLLNDKRQRERERGVDEPFSIYSWSGGYIWANYPHERGKPYLSKYNTEQNRLAKITSGTRGDFTFEVEDPSKLSPEMIVRINWYNKEGEQSSLINYLYDDQDVNVGVRHWESPEIPLTKQEVTILKIDGNKITVKEPLLHDLKTEWFNDITEWNYLSEVGIEDIGFEFLYQEYNYHHVEYGFNAIYLTNTTHSWIKNVKFRNGDNGILTDVCSNITIENVEVYGRKYHYGVHVGDCYNILAKDLYIQAPVVHTFTFNTGSKSCVYTNCVATTMPTFDQHSGLNYQNLFDNCTVYIDDPEHNPLTMGGAKYWSPSHAAFSTFWNIHFEYLFDNPNNDTIKIKGVTDSPSARLVGLTSNYPILFDYPINTYSEGINKKGISIKSLYEYQLAQRLGK